MNATTSMRLLFVAAATAPLIAFWPTDAQGPGQEDWLKHVKKACTSRRYGIRLAAARKVAGGGDAAVAAIESYAVDNGRNALPASLVDAVADSGKAGPKVSRLLWTWTMDPDFYWRSSAMRGLALRAPMYERAAADGGEAGLEPAQVNYLMSVRAENDPAWLMRTHARFGLALTGRPLDELFAIEEADPRARVRLATLLLGQGQIPPMQPLFDALADERTFLGTPWGSNLATEVNKSLRRWLGDEFPKFAPGDKPAAIAALRAVVEAKTGQQLQAPTLRADAAQDISGGLELLSCKVGDQFVQWTSGGQVFFGIDAASSATLSEEAWRALSQDEAAITLEKSVGVVICDSLRLCVPDAKANAKAAPASLPTPAADWLKRLAAALENAGEERRAADLRRGLDQFRAR